MNFADRLLTLIDEKSTPCIAGLDPDFSLLPETFVQERISGEDTPAWRCDVILAYNKMVIDAIADLVPAIKPQSAYYEVYGAVGAELLAKTTAYARSKGLLVILDAKRGDIGSTSSAYAKAYLAKNPPRDHEFDCMTLNPYLGDDSLQPFVDVCHKDGKGVFVCLLNSNPGGIRLQTMDCGGIKLYEVIAKIIADLAGDAVGERGFSSIGAVVGATTGSTATHIRNLLPRSIFLVPGLGAQGGDLDTIKCCFHPDGSGAVVSSSRSIMYPHLYGGEKGADPAAAIRAAMLSNITSIREVIGG